MKQFILTLSLLLATLATHAADFVVDGLYYNITSTADKTVEVTSKNNGGYSDNIVIPETVSSYGITYTVTKIGNSAFEGTLIRSIELPNSITTIGINAFADCTKLSSITLPASLTTINDRAFYGCYGLCIMTVLNPEPPSMGTEAFADSGLMAVYVPADVVDAYRAADGWKDLYIVDVATLPEDFSLSFEYDGIKYGITSIKDSTVKVMTDNYLSKPSGDIVIPETVTDAGIAYTVTKINSHAFYNCKQLNSVSIPASVTSISEYAFRGCSSLVVVTSLNPVPPTIDSTAFTSCDVLAVYVPKDAVEAYQEADVWKELLIADVETKPENIVANFTVDGFNFRVTSLIDYTAKMVTGDYSGDIVIPETVDNNGTTYTITEIGKDTFEDSSITSVKIPATVTSIGDYAFFNCTSLAYVTSLNPVPPTIGSTDLMGYTVFNGCNIAAIYVPAEAVDAYKAANYWQDFFITDIDRSGIGEVSAAGNDAAECYTLQGVRVNTVRTMNDLESLARGIYIVNGRKTLVK
jgi:hypothetical protein